MVTGQGPPPCSGFTLKTVGEKRAALYGGWNGSKWFNHLFIVELGRYSVVSVIREVIQDTHTINIGQEYIRESI